MELPEKLRYTKEHEWVSVDGGDATVGITEFAQEELGEIVFVETPEVGTEVKKGDSFCVVESTKAASDVYAPVSGKVEAVNEQLENQPELVNSSPFGEGWLVKLTDVSSDELAELMDAEQYKSMLGDS